MTPHKRRLRRLPREERPSDAPQQENPPEESPDGAQGLSEGQPASFSADNASGSTVSEQPDGESELYFPPLKSDEIGFSPLPALPKDGEPVHPPVARRRRRQNRLLTRPDISELGGRLESMAARAAPTFDFFLFSLLAGLVLGIGYLFDAPAILLFGILIAPLLAPWAGAALAAATGEMRFLGQTLGGFFSALLMVFVTGALAGLIARFFMPLPTTQALLHAGLSPFDLLLLAVGTLALTVAFVQSEEKPWLASLMLAYEIYLPVSAAGFGLASGAQNLWPQALLVLLVHLAVSVVLALIVFYYMGFRPVETSGYILVGLIVVASLAAVFAVLVWGNTIRANLAPATLARPTPTRTVSVVIQPTLTLSPEPLSSPTITMTPTASLTAGPTPIPTPVYGKVGRNGAYIRDEPGGAAITTLQSGYLVEILPDTPLVLEGTTWVRIRVKTSTRDVVGWALLNLIVTATPAPATPTASPTPGPIMATSTEGPSPTPTETLQPSGSYAVVNITQYDGSLNVRSGAGINNPLAGSLAYTATDIGRLGSPVTIGSAEWWQVQKTGGITGWVNASYLTEYVPSATFCADARVTALLTNLGTALKNTDGAALAALVSPKHGVDIRLASNNRPVNYTQATAVSIFTDSAVRNWGPSQANVSGAFIDVMQPKLLEVYNSSYQLGCNDTSRLGSINQPWPSEYTSINFYALYKQSTGDAPNWRSFLVGVEYVDGQPYLFALIYFEPVP
jgi:uncharacterized membrane protein